MRALSLGLLLMLVPGCATVPETREIDVREAQVGCLESGGLLGAIEIDKDGKIVGAGCVRLPRSGRES